MINDKESLKEMKTRKDRVKSLRLELQKTSKTILGEIAKLEREIRELDKARNMRIKKARFKKDTSRIVSLQNMLVSSIREIDRICTAGDICDNLSKRGQLQITSSEFVGKFKDAIKYDSRIVVENVTASFKRYSLKEWGGKKGYTEKAKRIKDRDL